ncbi:hypothetical protein RIF29_18677 [Crotalaria pallida]|uniref:Uncharacterized protein n=1 Tax=Crotalaria pallida TaxID=3830 RepID=A0AAN9F1D2_CROPI
MRKPLLIAHMYFCLVLCQILDDPSPLPSKQMFSPEFCSFVDSCLQKDPDIRPTAEQMRRQVAIVVEFNLRCCQRKRRKQRLYRFEKVSLEHEKCTGIVKRG